MGHFNSLWSYFFLFAYCVGCFCIGGWIYGIVKWLCKKIMENDDV